MRLLLVEGHWAHVLRCLNQNVIIDQTGSADEAVRMTCYDNYDLVLLLNAVSRPQDWASCVKWLHLDKAKTPAIRLTGRAEDNAGALEASADDAVLAYDSRRRVIRPRLGTNLVPPEYAVLEQPVLRHGLFVSKDGLLSQLRATTRRGSDPCTILYDGGS